MSIAERAANAYETLNEGCRRMLSWLVLWMGSLGCQEYSLGDDEQVDADDAIREDVELGPIGEAPMYVNASTALYQVDPVRDEVTFVGDFEMDGVAVERFVDLAMDQEGRLFGGTYDAVYEVGATTGALRLHCSSPADKTAMAFGADGRLYLAGGSRIEVMALDDDCAVSTLLDLPDYETSGDLVGSPDGYLYWSVRGDSMDGLVRVEPSTGAVDWNQTLGAQRVYGLGYYEQDVYGFTSFGKVVRASLNGSEAATVVATFDEAWWGATANPLTW